MEAKELLDMIYKRYEGTEYVVFAEVASYSMVAKNDVSEFIIQKYGGRGFDETPELLKRVHGAKYAKRYGEVIDILLNWKKLEE